MHTIRGYACCVASVLLTITRAHIGNHTEEAEEAEEEEKEEEKLKMIIHVPVNRQTDGWTDDNFMHGLNVINIV